MKTKIFISLFLLISVTSFILYRPSERTNSASITSETTSGNSDGRFLIGAVNSSFDDSSNYVHYDSLGLDLWHTYTGTSDIDPVTNQRYPFTNMAMNDKLLAPVDLYKADIQTKINSIYSHNESRLMLMRPKIEWLCYGQRSDYQCEDSLMETALWFYSFQSAGHNGGVDSQDFRYADGNRVRYFRSQNSTNGGTWVDSIGTVISKLKANTEQCRKSGTDGGNIWQTDEQWDWYIKPRIRIDSSFVENNPSSIVCKIIVIAENGSTILKEADIKARNFKQSQTSSYSGKYLEEFYFSPFNDTSNLTISGAWGNNNAYWSARGNRAPQNETNKMDIQVYWYGNCDMWIDYIRVDNEVANDLLSTDPSNLKHLKYESWLDSEVTQIGLHIPPGANTPPANKFYIELTEFNNYPCMAYVNKRLKYYSSDAVELIADWYLRNSIHVPWEDRSTVMTADFIKRFWIDSVGFKTFYAENYPYNSDTDPATSNSPGKIPSTLHVTGCSGSDPCGIMADPVPPAEFDNWLQDNMDHEPYYFSSNAPQDLEEYLWARGSYRFLLNLGDNISKSYNIPFILMPQSHSWYFDSVEVHNEPTNEELDLQANLAVSYGVKGLMYFAWDSKNNPGQFEYHRALTEPDGTLRRNNIYGQDKTKKQTMIDLINRMKIWEPYIMSFDNANRKSYIYRIPNERTEMSSSTFIKELKTYPSREFAPDPIPDLTGLNAETNNNVYLQAAFFHKENETEQTKYFMIVNRRSSPFIDFSSADNIGGSRLVTMKINPSNLPGFTNWKIYDLETGDTSFTFSKFDTTNYVFVGNFLPGEGKLFKLAPVMQEGGTLVADEEVQGITFVCNAPVYNNGKNISILEGTKIEFKSGAGLNLNSGSLLCSNSSTNTEENVLLKGYNSQNWNGIALDNTYKSKIQRTRFEDTKTPLSIESSSGVNLYNGKIIRKNYFKITEDSGKALSIRNQHNVSIDSNIFDITSYNSTVGIYFENNMSTESEIIPAGSPQEDPEDVFAGYINITKNKFIGGCYPVILSELGDNFSAYYIYNNEFVNTGLFGITARKISGIIKQNRFTDESQNYCLYLIESNPDICANIFKSEKRNIVLTNSFPMLAPIRNENGQLIFKGGRNSLIITTNNEPAENIYLKYSLPNIKLGENNFSIGNTYSYHIFGSIPPEGERFYNAIRNCWEGYNGLPSIFLFQGNDTNRLGYNYIPVSCIPSEETAVETQGIGFGIIDSTIITTYDSTDILSDDESLFYGAIEFKETGNFTEAIADFKALIDTHDSSEFIYSALDNLYSCYQTIDTSSDEEITDILYSDLKQYLETKISSGNYDEAFEENAYSFSLMCDTRLTNYNEALSGYEFIATYNPDAEQRLMASWEYENIEDLMNGEGGGERNLEFGISDLEFEKAVERRIKKLDEFVDRDPIKRHIKEEYVKTSNKNENSKTDREGIYAQKNPNEEKLIERSNQNIYGSKNLSKQQKEIRRFEDMKLLLNPDNIEVKKNIETTVPFEYSLSQNYPNPFNPVTHLEFGIPDLGFVSLKIYDILGREIKTLVNEIKPAGRYKIEFDGSNFASGVYFYRIEAGEFVQTKCMVLIK